MSDELRPEYGFDYDKARPNRFADGLQQIERLNMTAENFDRVLILLQEQRPYIVYTIELNSGQRFEIDGPKALAVRDGVAVFMAPGGIPIWFDHESVNQIIGAGAKTEV